jgi:filamentous hemagglutinin family protein
MKLSTTANRALVCALMHAGLCGASLAAGGIVTDGSVGGPGAAGRVQVLTGKNIDVPESIGSRAGANLFHSFSSFNIDRGQTVTFRETATGSVDNVVTRVTGPAGTEIDGTLRSTPGGHANFYLINPNGVTFREGASIDVPGSVHVSTANHLKFADGKRYSASAPADSSLSSATPSAFGFLGSTRANNALLQISGATLKAADGKTFDGVAGKVQVAGVGLIGSNIRAPAGEIRLVATRGKGEVSLSRTAEGHLPLPQKLPSRHNAGSLSISDSSMTVSGEGAGRIALSGNAVALSSARLSANNRGATETTPGNGITLQAEDLTLQKSVVTASAKEFNGVKPRAGSAPVEVKTSGRFLLSACQDARCAGEEAGNSYLESSKEGPGNAGGVKVKTGGDMVIRGSADAPDLRVGVYSQAEPNSVGAAGSVDIQTKGNISIAAGGEISTTTFSSGKAGNIRVRSSGRLTIDGDGIQSGIRAQTEVDAQGQGGTVTVSAQRGIGLRRLGIIASSTLGTGAAGAVKVSTPGALVIDGRLGRASPSQKGLATGILAGAGSEEVLTTGNAGRVSVSAARSVTIATGGEISGYTYSSGRGGKVRVAADQVNLSGGSINARSIGPGSSGKTGSIAVTATSQVIASGKGNISLENQSQQPQPPDARPGAMTISAPVVSLANGAKFSSRSTGPWKAADMRIQGSHALDLSQGAVITTEAQSSNGGRITVSGGYVRLRDSSLRTSVKGNPGNGGDILIDTDSLVLDTGAIEANAKSGNGGAITLDLQALIPSSSTLNGKEFAYEPVFRQGRERLEWKKSSIFDNVVQAVSERGLSNQIRSTAPQLNLNGVLSNLGAPAFEGTLMDPNYCAKGQESRLSILGKGGLPPKGSDLILY